MNAETELFVAIAWHAVGEPDAERTFLDDDGEAVPDLDEVVVGVFTERRLACIGAETYAAEHDPEHGGHGRVDSVSVHATKLNVHGTGAWLCAYDPATGRWTAPESVSRERKK